MKTKVFLALFAALSATLAAAPYTGQLTGDNGIVGTASWDSPETTFSWNVSQQLYEGTTYWHYAYTFSVPHKEISHFILETSTNIEDDDIFGYDGQQLYYLTGATQYSPSDPGNSNPNLPGDIFGIKLDLGEGTTDFSFSFYSTRVPMLGDFYAKDGRDGGLNVTAWNSGFGTDPNISLSDAALYGKIVVPDTMTTIVPAPAAVVLAGLGTTLVGWLRRRRSL